MYQKNMTEWGYFLKTKQGHAPSNSLINRKELIEFIEKYGKSISSNDNRLIYSQWPQEVKNEYTVFKAYSLNTVALKELLKIYITTLDKLIERFEKNPPQYPTPDFVFSEKEPYALETIEHNGKEITMDLYFEEFKDAWLLYKGILDLKEEILQEGALYSIFLKGKMTRD